MWNAVCIYVIHKRETNERVHEHIELTSLNTIIAIIHIIVAY